VKCPSCGTENKQEAVFCMSCGASLVQAPTPGSTIDESLQDTAEAPTIGYVFGTPDESAAPTTWTQEVDEQAPPPVAGEPPAASEVGEAPPLIPMAEPESIPAEADLAAGMPASSVEREEKGKPGYYLPPEADYHEPAPKVMPPPLEPLPAGDEASSVARDETQAMAPVAAAGAAAEAAAAARPRQVICPECYASNPENNLYCQECGSALATTVSRKAAAAAVAPELAGYQQTAVLPTQQSDMAQPIYAGASSQKSGSRWAESFGVADILVLVATLVVAVTMTLTLIYIDSFPFLKGSDISIFSHQGYAVGSREVLGGPGFLPYSGWEFFTVGMVTAVGIGLAVIFLLLRVGRGPMYLLAGCILLFPLAYLFFQAVLPLKGVGITPESSVGLQAMFLGSADFAGLGTPIWLISGAGILVIVAGFLAPPRGWGRLFTFSLFLGLIVGLAFLSAVCFNWGLFIEQPAAVSMGAAAYLASPAPGSAVFLC
jgi:hypothetical protein